MIFFGGEEFYPVFTVDKGDLEEVLKIGRRMKLEVMAIGKVKRGRGVYVRVNDEYKRLKPKGWIHLK